MSQNFCYRPLVANPNPETLKDSRAGFTNPFYLLHRAPLEAFALAYWTWALSQDDWLVEAGEARKWVQNLLETEGCTLPIRAVNNLAICRFGIQMLCRFVGRERLWWLGCSEEEALLQQARMLFPDGYRRIALDELLLLAASRAHRSLQYGDHWVMAAGKLVLRLDVVVDDLRDFAQRSGHPMEVLSAEAYHRQVKELVGNPDPTLWRQRIRPSLMAVGCFVACH